MPIDKFEIGQLTWCYQLGWCRVVSITSKGVYLVIVKEHRPPHRQLSFTLEGRENPRDAHPSLFINPPKGVDTGPRPFEKGERVFAIPREGMVPVRRYYSHYDEEKKLHYCFVAGKTEWSSNGITCDVYKCMPIEA